MTVNFLIDFDSTLVKLETLEVLADVALADAPDKDDKVDAVVRLTGKAMNGDLPFGEALAQRLAIINANSAQLGAVIDHLKRNVTASVARNAAFFRDNADSIHVVSSGFHEVVEPVVESLGLRADHVHANRFVTASDGSITSFDADNPLVDDDGKIAVARALGLKGKLVMVGDGWSDCRVWQAGIADRFYAFTENVTHRRVVEAANRVAPNFDEILFDNGFKPSVSYPKNRIEVLLLENIHQNAIDTFEKEGYTVRTIPSGVDEETLKREIENVSVVGIRSKTHITEDVLKHAKKLLAVGAFCIGTNQIDLEACARHGVAVFNAPYSNTRSVVELAIAEIVMLTRNLPEKTRAMHAGAWKKSASGSHEVRGKTLGIIGYGNIGMQLSVLAEAMGMKVNYYDLEEKLGLGNAHKCNTMDELLENSDIVTLHVDGRPENRNIFARKQIERMRDGAILLNLSRGFVVDVDALSEAMANGHIHGAGVDVFPKEPYNNKEEFQSPLRDAHNVILTPHIGGSTQEAQADIGFFVAGKLTGYINGGSTNNSVNFPNLQLPPLSNATNRLIHVHENVPGILAKINHVLADHDINIVGQYLKAGEQTGYVITDIATGYTDPVLHAIRKIEGTIRARILY